MIKRKKHQHKTSRCTWN